MPVTVFEPTTAKSGFIEKKIIGFVTTYTAFAASAIRSGQKHDTGLDYWWRGYSSFPTATLPNSAKILSARYNVQIAVNTGTNDDWITQWNIGTWIGAALTTADWDGGGLLCIYKDWTVGPVDGWLSLAINEDKVNVLDDTDFEIIDQSAFSAPTDYSTYWWNSGIRTCDLEVTWAPYRRIFIMG